jgi:putative endonuclease
LFSLIYRAADSLRRRSLAANHGRLGEDLAHRFLRSRGCTVVARNYRPPSGYGEIDLVAWHGEKLVFVEVKTRDTAEFGEPDRAVDAEKQLHLIRVAHNYARRANVEWKHVRFDVVSVVLSPRHIEWRRDAFHYRPD